MGQKIVSPKPSRGTIAVYIILRIVVIALLVRAIITADWSAAAYCVLTLLLFMLPSIVERSLKIDVPNALEIIVLLLFFAGQILGEVGQFFERVPNWDLILHTTSGFLLAAIGIALIDILNRSPKIKLSLSPVFVALVAFCFSMTMGVIWEFYEFSNDRWLGKDMQKDTMVYNVNSELFNKDGMKPAMEVRDITKTVVYATVNGEETQIELDGYVDIGIYDTMEDLFVNLIGAVVFSVIGYFFIKRKGSGVVADALIPRMLTENEIDALSAEYDKKRTALRSRLSKSKLRNAKGKASGSVGGDDSE